MGNRIRELRELRHMTQVRLSIELEVSQEAVSGYESGKHYPSYPILVRLSELLGVSIDYLMGRSDERGSCDCTLSSEEAVALGRYRALSPRLRERADAYLQGLTDQEL